MMKKYVGSPYSEMEARRESPYNGNASEMKSYADDLEMSRKKMAEGGPVKGKGILAIVARMKGKGGDMEEGEGMMEEEGGDMMKEAKMAAASEVMDALKSGDVSSFAAGLENFMKACGEYED